MKAGLNVERGVECCLSVLRTRPEPLDDTSRRQVPAMKPPPSKRSDGEDHRHAGVRPPLRSATAEFQWGDAPENLEGQCERAPRFPAGRNAWLSPTPSAALKERNRNICSIRRLGRREWHERSGDSKRAMVENAIRRYKTIIDPSMRRRTLACQRVDVELACGVLNTMAHLGMPDSCRVA
jgi:hypothetical protein